MQTAPDPREKEWCEEFDRLSSLCHSADIRQQIDTFFENTTDGLRVFIFETSESSKFFVKILPGKRVMAVMSKFGTRYYYLPFVDGLNSMVVAAQSFAEKQIRKYQRMQTALSELERTLES